MGRVTRLLLAALCVALSLAGGAWLSHPSGDAVPMMWWGAARLSDVARSQTYALQATQYLAWS